MTERLRSVQAKLASLHAAKRDAEATIRRLCDRIRRLDAEQRQLILADEDQRRTLASQPMEALSETDLAFVFATLARDVRTALKGN